jgi:hypothetical protein
VIASLSFRFAKTMPDQPHEYVVRTPENQAAYVALFEAIQTDGVRERYNGRIKRYLSPGDGWKYWTMTTHMPSSRVINRAKLGSPAALASVPVDDQNRRARSARWVRRRRLRPGRRHPRNETCGDGLARSRRALRPRSMIPCGFWSRAWFPHGRSVRPAIAQTRRLRYPHSCVEPSLWLRRRFHKPRP